MSRLGTSGGGEGSDLSEALQGPSSNPATKGRAGGWLSRGIPTLPPSCGLFASSSLQCRFSGLAGWCWPSTAPLQVPARSGLTPVSPGAHDLPPLCPLSPPLLCPSLPHQMLITLTQHPEVRPGMALAANCSVTALVFHGNWPGPDPTLALQFGFLRPEAAACRFLE